MQSESPILRDLREYYDKNKILSTNFDCKHLAKCQDCLPPTPVDATTPKEAENTFTEAKSAFVGDRYCECAPRLLFVSLDPGSALTDKDPGYNYISDESRSPEGVKNGELDRMLRNRLGKGRLSLRLHKTNKMAALILEKPVDEVMRFYAHVNTVKCCMNKKKRKQADKRLFVNCLEYLRGEIDILTPDVIITLGKEAKEGVARTFSISPPPQWAQEYKVVLRNGKEAVWFPSCHSSNYGLYKKQEEARNQFVIRMRSQGNPNATK